MTAPAAAGSRRLRRRAVLIGAAVLALAVGLGLGVVALLSSGDESPRYDDPSEMLTLARNAGLRCEEWQFGTIGSPDRRLVCFANGVERESHTITFLVTPREHAIPTRIERRYAPDGTLRPGDRWIVGDFWLVDIDRGLVPPALVERIADRLGGEVKRW